MKSATLILALAFLTACVQKSTAPLRASPVPEQMGAELSAPCQMPPPLATNDILALSLMTVDALKLLGDCAMKHADAVNAYNDARADAIEWNAGKPK